METCLLILYQKTQVQSKLEFSGSEKMDLKLLGNIKILLSSC